MDADQLIQKIASEWKEMSDQQKEKYYEYYPQL
jgi:hypothetical protein